MKKALTAIMLAGALAATTLTVSAEGLGLADLAGQALTQLGSNVDISSLNLGGLDLNNFKLADVNFDSLLGSLKNSGILENLDLSSLNLQGVLDLADNSQLLQSFGINSIDKDALQSALTDSRVSTTLNKILGDAGKGVSVKATIKGLAGNATVKELFTKVTGQDLSTVLGKVNQENVTELMNQGVSALFSQNTGAGSASASSLQTLLQGGINSLLGK